AASINTTQPRYLEVQRLLPAYPAALPGSFNTEVHIQRGFWLVSWFGQQFGQAEAAHAAALGIEPEALFEPLLDQTPPGAQGLTLLPHWSPGLRDPGPEAKGAVIGFGDVHGRAHLYRAIIEGIVHQLRAGRELTEKKLGRRLARLVVSGGGSRSAGAVQIAADVFGLAAERPRLTDSSALGAAMLAAAGLGWYPDVASAARAMAGPTERFEPRPENVALYERLHREVFAPLAPRLAPLNRRLRAITGYPG
ncbi:MAG: carbohydrate kinase, partial [Burkholderiales bacterium]|nr:carbohydrate kinase [Burkholderiales bacterium]